MGLKRNIGSHAAAIALILCGGGVRAAPREPLVVTELGEQILVPVSEGTRRSSDDQVDEATARFSLAVAQSLQSDERALEEICRSGPPPGLAGKAKFDWQARCLYRRH